MTTAFPGDLDDLADKVAGELIEEAHVNDLQDAVEAIEAKVGADSSAVTTSHDYKIAQLETNAVLDGDAAGGVLAGTYPNPSFASDLATQTELDAHINDTADAHDASAISVADAGNDFTATDVEGVLAELQADHETDVTDLSDHEAATTSVHGIADTSALETTTGAQSKADAAQSAAEATAQAALDAHTGDTAGAHAASAIAFTPTDTIAATDVQAAIAELGTEDAAAHIADASDAHAASAITNTPAGNIAATTVQAAIDELDSEKAATASAVMDGDAAGGVLSGTYPNPGFASDLATQAELDAHVNDAAAAHAASAISIADAGGDFTATDVEGALDELQADNEAHVAAADPHTGYVLESLFDANTVIAATVDNTPVAVTVAEQTLLGRITGGAIDDLSVAQVKTLLAMTAAEVGAYGVKSRAGYYMRPPGLNNGNQTLTQNELIAVPLMVPAAMTVDRIGCYVGTAAASSTVRLGIYAADGTSDGPGTLILDAGTIDSSGTGVREITISQALSKGLVWLACVAQGGAPAIQRTIFPFGVVVASNNSIALGDNPCSWVSPTSTSGALPAFGAFTTPKTSAPVIAVRVV